jgi:hypothetical protein
MADYTKSAVYQVRDLIWNELLDKELFNDQDYYADGFTDPLIPIIPAQQVPEFNNLLPGKPYITYDLAVRPYGQAWWICEEVISLSIVSTNASQIQSIINLLVDLFRRYDKSAKDADAYVGEDSLFNYHYFYVESADPIQSFDNEGGFMVGDISILYAYTRDLDMLTGRYS